MSGRAVLQLLAGLLVIIAPISTASQNARLPGVGSNSVPRFGRDPGHPLPIREPVAIRPHFPTTTESARFSQLARSAGAIFSGTVTGVQRHAAARGQTVATVAITFHIENAIRGVARGGDYTIYEWIGLWSGGQRYRRGERVLVLLYPRSKLGLSSCVGGSIGRFAVDPQGKVLLSSQQISAFRRHPVLGGKSRVLFSDFALAVRQASEEE